MSRLTATMVVDLTDKTGGKTRAIIGNLDRLKRAERDYMLADKGLRLSNRDRAMERLMIERERSIAERQASVTAWASRAGLATTALGYGAMQAYRSSAQLEREIGRIVINADKGRDAIDPIVKRLRQIADDNRMPFQDVVSGFKELIAAGRELDEAMAFLPSVTLTAQASGSAVADIAKTADAVAGSLKISAAEMQTAFDDLVEGGKVGKFELEQMSQYLPSIAPAFAALGYEGTEGLAKLVAMLQVVRMQTGSSGEAATNFSNVINKIYSAETARKFEKNFGIDLPAALDKTRAAGGDVLQEFIRLAGVATKGDLTKLSQIFEDQEAQKGLRAMIMLGGEYRGILQEIIDKSGTARADAGQIFDDSQAKLDRLSNNWDAFVKNVGKGVAAVANPALEQFNEAISEAEAKGNYQNSRDRVTIGQERAQFDEMYREQNPDASRRASNLAYTEAVTRVGRGQAKSIFDELELEAGRRRGGAIMERFLTGSGGRGRGSQGLGAGPATNDAPVPLPRGQSREQPFSLAAMPSARGRYVPTVASEMALDAARRGRAAGLGGSTDALPGKLADDLGIGEQGPRAVKIEGTPQVTITNPPARPNVTMHITINEASDASAIAQQIGNAVNSKLNGQHGSSTFSGL